MDPQIEQLKELVRQNIALTQETHDMVRSIRRSGYTNMVFKVLWWVVIFGGSWVAYYLYVQPYVDQLLQLYTHMQAGGAQAQGIGTAAANFLSQLVPKQQ